jgi:hypothetical protein
MSKQVNNNSGIGFYTLLAIILIILKLTGYIAWSWWWVILLSPMIALSIFGFIFIVAFAWAWVTHK